MFMSIDQLQAKLRPSYDRQVTIEAVREDHGTISDY